MQKASTYLAAHANSEHICYGRTYAEALNEARLFWYTEDEDALQYDLNSGILQITKQQESP